MKKVIICLTVALVLLCSCASKPKSQPTGKMDMVQAFEESYVDVENIQLELALEKMGIDISKPIPDSDLSILNLILRNTYEISIHRMRGEDENEVYTNDDGREFVYDKDGKLVTNAWNQGSYNYAPYSKPVDKFLLDILPWIVWGNTRDDPTSMRERLYYYSMDLFYSVQYYIFLDDMNELEPLTYSSLDTNGKRVYHLFYKLLLNPDYKIKLNKDENTLLRLRQDQDYYWAFFNQVMATMGFYPVE
ncbi:MAG: hypothetical protein J6T20_04605 [Treponema sp.]|nr:hypothetical protein [Treponema sp.]